MEVDVAVFLKFRHPDIIKLTLAALAGHVESFKELLEAVLGKVMPNVAFFVEIPRV